MTRTQYFEHMKQLARETRLKYEKELSKLGLTSARDIYRREGIELEYRDFKSPRIRAIYFCDEVGCTVAVKKSLPKEPKLFALLHELKHHIEDRDAIAAGRFVCGDYNENELVEVGAEVFAAEVIYPEADVINDWAIHGPGAGGCTAEDVVRFKRAINRPVSYTMLVKRLKFLGLVPPNSFPGTQFQKLEERMFPPIWKEQWFIDLRKRRKSAGPASPKPSN